MEDKQLDIHITDIISNIDLKIYEKNVDGKLLFDCYIHNLNTDGQVLLTLEEKVAALLFEGFNQIFVEDDTEYQANEQLEESNNTLNNFFDILRKCDEEYFNLDEGE